MKPTMSGPADEMPRLKGTGGRIYEYVLSGREFDASMAGDSLMGEIRKRSIVAVNAGVHPSCVNCYYRKDEFNIFNDDFKGGRKALRTRAYCKGAPRFCPDETAPPMIDTLSAAITSAESSFKSEHMVDAMSYLTSARSPGKSTFARTSSAITAMNGMAPDFMILDEIADMERNRRFFTKPAEEKKKPPEYDNFGEW